MLTTNVLILCTHNSARTRPMRCLPADSSALRLRRCAIPADEIICATGQRPNLHSCGTVRPPGHRELRHPEPGFYTLGVKSYGRAPTFLMATGFEQARSVAAALAGDLAAADRVELELPETGACGVAAAQLRSACCG